MAKRLAAPAAGSGRQAGLLRRSFSSLRIRNYRLWFVGQTVSQSGTWMQSTAKIWLVFKLTHHNAFDVGLTAALQFAPVLVLGAFGGLVADRFDKRHVLLATQTAFTVQAVALFAIVVTGVVQLWMVWALALVMGLVNALDNPSRQSFVVEMVGPDDLANAVGLNSVIVNSSRLVGPALAGLLIIVTGDTVAGLSWIFLVNALSFGAVIGALLAMRPGELHRRAPVARAAGQVRAGLRYAWHKQELRVPLLMMAVIGTWPTTSTSFCRCSPVPSSTVAGAPTARCSWPWPSAPSPARSSPRRAGGPATACSASSRRCSARSSSRSRSRRRCPWW